MLEVPIRAFPERAVAGPEYASIACPKAAPSIKLQPSTGTSRPSPASRRAVLHWTALALRKSNASFPLLQAGEKQLLRAKEGTAGIRVATKVVQKSF